MAQAKLIAMGARVDEVGAKMGKGLANAAKVGGEALLALGVVAGTALVAGLVFSEKAAANFQAGLTRLYTTAGETKANLDMVGKGILGMSVEVGTGAQELLKGMYWVESAGFHGAAGLNVLKIAAEGARAENSDLSIVAHALTGVLNTYADTNITAAQAMNVLIGSVGQGATTLGFMSDAISHVLPAGSKFHLQLIDLTTAIATMTNQNDDAASAATHLRQVILALESPAKAGARALAEIGISSDQLHIAMSKSLPGAIQLIIDMLGKRFPEGSAAYNDALKSIAGGNKQLMGLLELSGSSLDKWKAAVKAVTGDVKAGGSAVMGWADVQGNFNFKVGQAKAAVEAAAIAVGTKLLPLLGPVLDALTPLVTTFSKWATSSSGLSGFLTNIGDAFSKVFGPAKQANAALSPLTDTFDRATGALKSIKSSAQPMLDTFDRASGVFLKTHTAVNPLVAVFQKIKDVIATVSDIIQGAMSFWQGFYKNVLTPVGNFLRDTFAPAWKSLQDALKQLAPLWTQLVAAIGPALPALKVIGTVIGGILLLALMGLIKTLGLLAQGAVLAFGIIATVIMMGITGFLRFLKTVTDVVHAIVAAWKWLQNLSNQIWGAIISAIVGFVQRLVNTLVGHSLIPDLINSIVTWFASLPGKALAAIASLASRLAGFFSNLATAALTWGRNLIANFVNGILAGIGAAVSAAMSVAKAVAGVLHHSKPEEGPLRDDDVWGYHMAQNFASGLRAGLPQVQTAAQMIAARLAQFLQMSGALSLAVTGSFSGSAAGAGPSSTFRPQSPSFTPMLSQPMIYVTVNVQSPDLVVDGHSFVNQVVGPHLPGLLRRQTGNRRPA